MENQNITLEVKTENPELIIRTGTALDQLPERELFVSANIKAPGEYLKKCKDQIDPEKCYVEANIKLGVIQFKIGKHEKLRDEVVGRLYSSELLDRLKINSGEQYNAKALGNLLKKNKFLAHDENEFTSLIGKLLRFSAKINTVIEKSQDQSGSSKDLIEKQVQTDIPGCFWISCPIFEGMDKEVIVVDIYAEATSAGVFFTLESTELIILQQQRKEEIFKSELEPFQDFCPVFYS